MGATAFDDTVSTTLQPDFRLAFSAARERAARSSGSDSYSGSVSEKSDAVPFPRSLTDLRRGNLSASTVTLALSGSDTQAQATFLHAWPRLAPELRAAQGLYDNKWAAAVGFRFGDEWHFVGLASS